MTPSPAATTGARCSSTLDRANLFIVALDDRREWYRYHHLFADVLRARLLSEQPDQVALLHQRASEWYERHDLTEEAVRHALAGAGLRPGGAPDRAGGAGRSDGTGRRR